MQYGMYVSASSVAAAMARQDVVSNNLANVNTVGYRPDALDLRHRLSARQEDSLLNLPSNALLERLGAGVQPMGTRVTTKGGPLMATGNPLDVAIEGDDGFFVTSVKPAFEGDSGLRFTRDGRLTMRSDGTLVTASGGYPLLDTGGSPIRVNPLSPAPLTIDADGTVRQGQAEVGKFRVASVAEPAGLIKEGDNMLSPRGQEVRDVSATVRSGHAEASGVDAIRSMMAVTSASNAASSGLGMISYYSDMMSRAIQSLGRP
ncbi:MAG: flagellar hook-basal body protein [Planctomycetes bacterium]|nr:flagellar hook-basal body protein [Planctomycetota bacterium]